MTEEVTHRRLWLVLAAVSAATLYAAAGRDTPFRETGRGASDRVESELPAFDEPAADRLARAIRRLADALDEEYRSAPSLEHPLQVLRAFGYPRVARGPRHGAVARFLADTVIELQRGAPSTESLAAVVALMESGVDPSETLPFAPDAPTLRSLVGELLARPDFSLAAIESTERRGWVLHLRALWTLSLRGEAAEPAAKQALAQQTRIALVDLDRRFRKVDAQRGRGALDAAALGHGLGGVPDLHLATAALIAAAGLREAEIDALAVRRVRSLMFRAPLQVAALQRRPRESASSLSEGATQRRLGQLLEALHAAHLFLSAGGGESSAGLAREARRAVGALLASLERASATGPPGQPAVPDRLGARVAALRGLRVARFAYRSGASPAPRRAATHRGPPNPSTEDQPLPGRPR